VTVSQFQEIIRKLEDASPERRREILKMIQAAAAPEINAIDRLLQIRDTLLVTWMAIVSDADDGQKRAVVEVLNACVTDLDRVIDDMRSEKSSRGAK
jgi:hypothetical protein